MTNTNYYLQSIILFTYSNKEMQP